MDARMLGGDKRTDLTAMDTGIIHSNRWTRIAFYHTVLRLAVLLVPAELQRSKEENTEILILYFSII